MPDHKQIAELAYQRWLDRGQPQDGADEDWHAAARQLSGLRELPSERDPHSLPDATRTSGEVIVSRHGRQYGATYTLLHGMLQLRTHTETRSVQMDGQDPADVARAMLEEIIDAQPQT